MDTRRAVIDWIPRDQGGRSQPPKGVGSRPYTTVMRFVDDPWPSDVAWSLVIGKHDELSERRWIADVHFLVEEAPHEALREGRQFELYEGSKCVACGQILDESDPFELGSELWKTFG